MWRLNVDKLVIVLYRQRNWNSDAQHFSSLSKNECSKTCGPREELFMSLLQCTSQEEYCSHKMEHCDMWRWARCPSLIVYSRRRLSIDFLLKTVFLALSLSLRMLQAVNINKNSQKMSLFVCPRTSLDSTVVLRKLLGNADSLKKEMYYT